MESTFGGWAQTLSSVVAGDILDAEQARGAMQSVLSGEATPAQIAGLLCGRSRRKIALLGFPDRRRYYAKQGDRNSVNPLTNRGRRPRCLPCWRPRLADPDEPMSSKPMPPTDPLALIRRSIGLCQMMRNWPAPVLDTLAAAARLGRYARHEQILAEDPLRREVLVVASGGVAVDSVDASGARFLLSIHGPGEITALMRLLEDVGFVYDFHAREPTVLVHIPADALLGALDAHPPLWRDVCVLMLSRAHEQIVMRCPSA